MSDRRNLISVSVFTVVMLLVAAMLIVVFGEFRFASSNSFRATFSEASRLKSGQDVRIAGVPVGSVKDVTLNPDNTVDVSFDIDERYQLYTSTRAAVRYENLVGDRYLEITSGPGELRKLPPGDDPEGEHRAGTRSGRAVGRAAPGGQGPRRVEGQRTVRGGHRIAAGPGGALSSMLASTSAFSQNLAARDQLIGEVIDNLNIVLATVDEKGAEFDASVDRLQQLITGLSEGRDPIAGAIGPLATAENDLTEMLKSSRRPLQGVIEQLRPLATELDDRKAEVNEVIEPLAENYLRLNALGPTVRSSTSSTVRPG